jgi:multiple sugar transport system substrate-binding protein
VTRRIHRRTILQQPAVAAMAAGTGLLAAACGRGGPWGAAERPDRSSATLGPATVRYLHFFNTSDPQAVVFPRAEETFKQKFPQLTVEPEFVPNAELAGKLQVTVAAGTPPDVVSPNPRVITPLYSLGLLAELDPYVKHDAREVKLDDFYPAPMQRAIKQGKHFALPLQMGLHVLAFNRTLFGAAGVNPPTENWTWETFTDAAHRLTNRQTEPMVFGSNRPSYEIPVWAWGGEVLDKTEKRLLLDQPAALAALEWRAALRARHRVEPLPEDGRVPAELERFLTGRQAMWITITGSVSRLERESAAPQWDLAILPKGSNKRATIVQGPSLALVAASKQRDAGWEWLKHYLSPEIQRIATEEAKVVSARRSATEGYVKQASPYNRRPLVESANFAFNQPFIAQYDEMMQVISAALGAIDSGEKSPRQAIQEAKPQVEGILAQG